MQKKDVTFFSEGAAIAAHVYTPDGCGNKQFPALILCHGFAAIKEIILPAYAEVFVRNGFVVLAFDYRGFGASEGPRGRFVPYEQITDIRNAVTYIQSLSYVDKKRIGLWGTSFGGANAISTAAIDTRVKALTVQLTFSSGEKSVKGNLDEEKRKKLDETLAKAWEREVTKNSPLSLPPHQLLTDEDSKSYYMKVVEQYPAMKTKIPLTTLRHIIEYNPKDAVSKLTCPILIIAADKDIVCPPEHSQELFQHAREPKKFVMLEQCTHYDAYEGNPFEKGSQEAIQWFKHYV